MEYSRVVGTHYDGMSVSGITIERVCKTCKAVVRDGDIFCPKCGHKYDHTLKINVPSELVCGLINSVIEQHASEGKDDIIVFPTKKA